MERGEDKVRKTDGQSEMCLESRGKGWLGSLGFSMVSDRNRDKTHYEIITDALKVDDGGRSVGIERDEMVGYLPKQLPSSHFPP